MSLLTAEGVTRIYGGGCGACRERTGPGRGTSRCPECESIVACADVSLSLERGEVLGVVGESGSGKSSLAEALALRAGREGTVAGEVRYVGHEGNLLEADYQTRQRLRNGHLGFVHQHIRDGLDPEFSGGGNVAEKLLAAGEREFEAVRERVAALFEETEVPLDRVDDPTHTYSGGMQRRVQIARALVTDPATVVLDEPTTGLDASVQARVLDTFRRVQREEGVAALVVSHDLGVVRLLADRTLVMRHGCVVESGLTDRILEDPHHEYTQTLINSVI
ncbi:MAG: ATP-binding cassette domain-containing protein [Halobacteriales archaeon]